MLALFIALLSPVHAAEQVHLSAVLLETDDSTLAHAAASIPSLDPVSARLATLVLREDPRVHTLSQPTFLVLEGEPASMQSTSADTTVSVALRVETMDQGRPVWVSYRAENGDQTHEAELTLKVPEAQWTAVQSDQTILLLRTEHVDDNEVLVDLSRVQAEAERRYTSEFASRGPRARRRALLELVGS